MDSLAELTNTQTELNAYFNALELNLVSTANALPSFEDFNQLLVSDSTITDAQAGANRGASFATGALAEHAYLIAAIQREFAMRGKTRSLYFTDGHDDVNRLLDFINYWYGTNYNYIRGKAPEQHKE